MAGYNNQLGSIDSRFYRFMVGSIITIFLILFFYVNCSSDKRGPKDFAFKRKGPIEKKWENVFEYLGPVHFEFADPDEEIVSIGCLLVNSKKECIVNDVKQKKIFLFDASGKFKKNIGRFGEGPGENLLISSLFKDTNDNLYTYDISKRRISMYSAYDYEFSAQFLIIESIHDAIVNPTGGFITYRLFSDKDNLLYKSSLDSKIIKSTFIPQDKNVKLFIARFNLGSISEVPSAGFLFLFPEEYKVYFYDYDLNLKRIFYSNESSKFSPPKIILPGNLSPFDYTKKHARWWSNSLRPAGVYFLGDGIFVCILIQYENLSEKWYINVHDLEGNILAEGLEVPFSGYIQYAGESLLYVVEESTIDKNNNILPLKVHRYRFKNNSKRLQKNKGGE